MSFKKVMSSILITTQLGFAANVLAAGPTANETVLSATPEITLLQRSIALEGMNISKTEMQAQLSTIMSDYVSTSTTDGQQQRMQEALVTLGLYTPQQAENLMNDVANSPLPTDAKVNAVEVSRLLAHYPSGAEFSGCDAAEVFGPVSAAALVTGALVWALSSGGNGSSNIKTFGEYMTAAGAAGVVLAVLLANTGDC